MNIRLTNRIILTNLLWLSSLLSMAQTNATSVVSQFGQHLETWSKTGDERLRDSKIDPLVTGNVKCRVQNNLMNILLAKYDPELLINGTREIDTYLNEFTKAFDDGVKYSHDTPIQLQTFSAPTLGEKDDEPIQYVSMSYAVTGAVDARGKDVYYVRGKHITKIVDANDKNTCYAALQLYNQKEYEAAFNLFRKLAFEDPNNYEAQYYTTIMEIKGQGCKKLNKKVRDLESAWWMTRAILIYKYIQRMGRNSTDFNQKLATLAYKYTVSYEELPYSNFTNESALLEYFVRSRLSSCGLTVCMDSKTLKYGFMNEAGVQIVDCKYDLVWPFDGRSERALVLSYEGGIAKFGYIDNTGREVVKPVYARGSSVFINGRTFVLNDNTLLLIDNFGSIEKVIGTGYDGMAPMSFGSTCYVHHKASNLYYVFDYEGNILEKQPQVFKVNIIKGVLEQGDKVASLGW